MKAFSPVLPNSPEFPETVLAKDQPQYNQLPVAHIEYSDGVKSMISRYKLSWRERWKMLIRGEFWLEQLTFGQCLRPQRPTVDEPLRTKP